MPFAATWTDIEIAILSDVSQRKTKYHMIALLSGILKKKKITQIHKIEVEP